MYAISSDAHPLQFHHFKLERFPGNQYNLNHSMSANDMVQLSPMATGLSLLLHVCGNFGLEHDIRCNSEKSAVIIFFNSFVNDFTFPSFVMNCESIMEVPFVKYLGHVIISADMKDGLDIMRQCRQLYAQGNALARRFHMCSDNVKVTIFHSHCSSLYTSQLWWKCEVSSIKKVYVAYNNEFRMLFRLPRDCSASGMFAVHNVMSCPVLVRKFVFCFYKRVRAFQNCIAQAICGSDIWWKSSFIANWNKLLYFHNADQGIGTIG